MKVICVKNTYSDWGDGICHHDLTIGKEYDAKSLSILDENYYTVIDDCGKSLTCSVLFFVPLYKIRDRKLEKLGI